jgi:hypothetical protein
MNKTELKHTKMRSGSEAGTQETRSTGAGFPKVTTASWTAAGGARMIAIGELTREE